MSDEKNENLKAAYQQLCDSYRAIDDFRTKLLGFLPLATGSGIFLLLGPLSDKNTGDLAQQFMLPVGAFGFVITLGLFCYELYGIKKCHHLIKAGKQSEVGLRVGGQFRNRPREVAHIINEPFAAGVIYPAVLAAWTFLALRFVWPQNDAWPPYASWIAIAVFIVGFAVLFIYDLVLRKRREPVIGDRTKTKQEQINKQNMFLMYNGDKAERAKIASDIVWHEPGDNPVSGTHHGFKEYTKLMPTRMAPSASWDFTLGEVMVNGDFAMITFRLQGECKNKTIDLRGGHLMKFNDEGQIVEGWGFTDNQDVLDEFLSQ